MAIRRRSFVAGAAYGEQVEQGAPVTPAELRELAAAVEATAVRIDELRRRLIAADVEPAQPAGWRLENALAELRHGAGTVQAAADILARVRALPGQACRVPWGVCPDHGATLSSSGGRAWCRTCRRSWGYDRLGLPCAEPVLARVVDADGVEVRMCAGHTLDARSRLVGATITLLADA